MVHVTVFSSTKLTRLVNAMSFDLKEENLIDMKQIISFSGDSFDHKSITKLQSRPKIVGTLELYHVSPIPPNQCWIMSRFSNKKGKKSPDYQH